MPRENPDVGVELPDVHVNLVKVKQPSIARVVGNAPCTHGKSNAWVRNIALDVGGTRIAGNFKVGQAVGVLPPGTDEQGKPYKVRLYSIASSEAGEDGAGQVVCTPVKRVIDEFQPRPGRRARRGMFMGVCSNYLCDLEIGAEVLVTGPVGKRFLLPVDPARHDYVFVATGTGIAPFRGMLLQLLRGNGVPSQSQIWLLMGAPYSSDLLYHEQLLALERECENFHYLRAISREPHDDGERGIYVDRLLDLHSDELAPLLRGPRSLLYLCGISGMQFGVFRRLQELGVLQDFAKLRRPPDGKALADCDDEELKHALKPTARCMIEVY